jgi:class 3 adenylate cyclase
LEALDDIFRIPKVAVFAGHMIDTPGRSQERFPAGIESAVAEAIRSCLAHYDVREGFAGAACGGDILFHEALLERGGEGTIVLPQQAEGFRVDSVDFAAASWGDRFEQLLATVRTRFGKHRVLPVSRSRLSAGSISYEFANRVMIGLATLRGQQIANEIVPIVLWDGLPGDGFGGTATMAARMLRAFGRVVKIDLRAIRGGESCVFHEIRGSASASLPPESKQTAIGSILFADVVGFSSLTDDQNPLFVEHFLGLVAEELEEEPALVKNTWGDGLFIVFASPRAAGLFALRLRDAVKRHDWSKHGLPDLGLRIGLHAGPGYFATDPVTGAFSFVGGHVSYGARIEPVALKNEVFATLQFAALLSETGVSDFRAEYAGLRTLPKLDTKVPLWRLEWTEQS